MSGIKVICDNKKARFDYFVLDSFEAGIVLTGNEVKSVAEKGISLNDCFCFISGGELWLKNCHITPYDKGNFQLDSRRDRKLLLHRSEIDRLAGKINAKGFTLVPLKVYFKGNKAKVELGLCQGKKLYDKRETLKKRDVERRIRRELF